MSPETTNIILAVTAAWGAVLSTGLAIREIIRAGPSIRIDHALGTGTDDEGNIRDFSRIIVRNHSNKKIFLQKVYLMGRLSRETRKAIKSKRIEWYFEQIIPFPPNKSAQLPSEIEPGNSISLDFDILVFERKFENEEFDEVWICVTDALKRSYKKKIFSRSLQKRVLFMRGRQYGV